MNTQSLRTTWSTLKSTFKKDKKALLIVAVGALALAALLFADGCKRTPKETQPAAVESAFDASSLQQELTKLLSSVRGAGRTRVMITFESGAETVFQKDEDASTQQGGDAQSGTHRTETVILKNGSSENALRLKEIYPRVRGVAVLCEGGANAVTKAQIIALVTALFDIKSTNVSVAEMAAKEEP